MANPRFFFENFQQDDAVSILRRYGGRSVIPLEGMWSMKGLCDLVISDLNFGADTQTLDLLLNLDMIGDQGDGPVSSRWIFFGGFVIEAPNTTTLKFTHFSDSNKPVTITVADTKSIKTLYVKIDWVKKHLTVSVDGVYITVRESVATWSLASSGHRLTKLLLVITNEYSPNLPNVLKSFVVAFDLGQETLLNLNISNIPLSYKSHSGSIDGAFADIVNKVATPDVYVGGQGKAVYEVASPTNEIARQLYMSGRSSREKTFASSDGQGGELYPLNSDVTLPVKTVPKNAELVMSLGGDFRVRSLLHFDDPVGTTEIIDEVGTNAWSTVGSAHIVPGSFRIFGNALGNSVSGNGAIVTNTPELLNVFRADFYLDFVFRSQVTTGKRVLVQVVDELGQEHFRIQLDRATNPSLVVFVNGVSQGGTVISTAPVQLGIKRSANVLTLYTGTSGYINVAAPWPASAPAQLAVGGKVNGSEGLFVGEVIDEFRVLDFAPINSLASATGVLVRNANP